MSHRRVKRESEAIAAIRGWNKGENPCNALPSSGK